MKVIIARTIKITLLFCTSLALHTTHTMERQVIHNTGISEGERAYLNNRLPMVKAALEKMLSRSLEDNQVPKIALVGSGGGYRAMFCTTGSLCAAEEIGLLDATTYITALSGSTWAVAPWISTGKPLHAFKTYLQNCAAKPFGDLSLEEEILMVKALAKKNVYHQPLTLVDPYGSLLANRLLEDLSDKRQKAKLSDQAQKVESGAYPYPIYTAIDGRESIITGQTWYEFTPHTIGDRTNNMHIPTTTYGKKFKEGNVVKDAPEKSLAYLMGTWGSAFGANVHEIIQEIIKKKTISNFKDEKDSSKPVVIYLPRISDEKLWEENRLKPEFAEYNLSGFDLDYETNKGFCETQHFQYTLEHSSLVMNQTKFNMLVNKDAIIKEINSWIDRK